MLNINKGVDYMKKKSRIKKFLDRNPKLKNPSIWEDTKYWITTAFALVASIISIISIFQLCLVTNYVNSFHSQ